MHYILFWAYRAFIIAAYPFIVVYMHWRKYKGKEDKQRFQERFGHASAPRPAGKLMWLHASSVGESLLLLPLIDALQARYPAYRLLLTTGTVTSAALMAKRLPAGVMHQYMPIDTSITMRRFLAHWQPNLALITESEFWPHLLYYAKRQCPILLISARISDRSFARWQKFSVVIRALLSHFDAITAGGVQDAERLKQLLGPLLANRVIMAGNLKFAASPLPFNPDLLAPLEAVIAGRPVFLASSTHAPEELAMGKAQAALLPSFPNLLSIIVPRHPHRSKHICEELEATYGLKVIARSSGQPITSDTQVYIADTMGELGLFYRLCDIVFMGGSLLPHGGQNLLEPARLGTALLAGPHTHNFREIVNTFKENHALIEVESAEMLAEKLERLLSDSAEREAYKAQALKVVTQYQSSIIDTYLDVIAHYTKTT